MDRRPFPPRTVIVVAVLGLAFSLTGCVRVSNIEAVLTRASDVAQTSKVFAADGTLLASLHAEIDRELIPLEDVPQVVRDAVVAVEDARFYDHAGVDYTAIVRALLRNTSEGTIVEGGSTITQQLVKNTIVEPQKTLKRKVREAVIAHELERRFTKDEILERYLNTVYFGRSAYGIQTAARTYFRKPASKLTLTEAALLAGMIRSPGRYDPQASPQDARARRDFVLSRMRQLGMIDKRRFARATRAPLGLRPARDTGRYSAPYFVEHVKQLIFDGGPGFERLGETRADRINAVFRAGLRIETTLDPRLQTTAEEVARAVLPYKRDPHTAFVAMDPATGGITAMVGGRDFFAAKAPVAKMNLATQARRQPGSAFKPFTLVAALEQGISLSRSYRAGARLALRTPGGEIWSVGNYEGRSFGSSMTLERATALSVNVVYAQAALEVGADRIVEVAHRMGIESPLAAYPSIALGAQEVTPLELATAYATLANGGHRVRPMAITRITAPDGTVLYSAKPKRTRVLSAGIAAQAVHALQEVMRSGTGRGLQTGFPTAGKTGTSDEYHDAWFAGFTPRMVGVSWVGFPQRQIPMRPPRTRIRVFGSSWPGQMWRAFMIEAHKGLPALQFASPEDVLVRVRVDTHRDCLPNDFTPSWQIEERSFVRGTEPKKRCTEPSSAQIAMPSLVGMTPARAHRTLLDAGLQASTERRYCPSVRPGLVCAHSPAAGDAVSVGSTIRVWLSDDDAVGEVPIILGMSVREATDSLRAAGFDVEVIEGPNDEQYTGCRDPAADQGTVWAQSPCGGARYGRGATVTVYAG